MFVQKICCSKNVVSKERQTDLQFLRRETHLQQRSVYKTAHTSVVHLRRVVKYNSI